MRRPGPTRTSRALPFVGQAGKLLDKLLDEIGLARADVFIANVLKCRPPGNRDPQPDEIASCRRYLEAQVELIEPDLICTLGNFSTKLLRADTTGISRLHGQAEERMLGPRNVRLYPLYHPAAALYTPSTLEALRADFHRIPELIALGPLPQPEPAPDRPRRSFRAGRADRSSSRTRGAEHRTPARIAAASRTRTPAPAAGRDPDADGLSARIVLDPGCGRRARRRRA